MAQFIGTIEEFNEFIGGYSRNKIQNLTRKHKKNIKKCEECGSRTKKLEAAHIRGKERPSIIAQILQNYTEDDIVNIDLRVFEEQYVSAHNPIEKTIRVLCKPCHLAYDKKNNKSDSYVKTKLTDLQKVKNIINSIKVSKHKAIEILKEDGFNQLNNSNTIFSNINKALDVYWLEPNNDKFSETLFIILNDYENSKLLLFLIPKKTIINPELIFEQRSDKNASKIIINSSDNTFKDKNGYDLKPYLAKSINY